MASTQTLDSLTFLRAWLAPPLRVGAAFPSGASLARMITARIGPATGAVIELELRPGTGVFTQALIARGVPKHRLTLIEAGSEFATLLEARFPEARTRACPVQRPNLDRLGLRASHIGCALANLPPASVYRIQRRS